VRAVDTAISGAMTRKLHIKGSGMVRFTALRRVANDEESEVSIMGLNHKLKGTSTSERSITFAYRNHTQKYSMGKNTTVIRQRPAVNWLVSRVFTILNRTAYIPDTLYMIYPPPHNFAALSSSEY
jgi:hypothetical protein